MELNPKKIYPNNLIYGLPDLVWSKIFEIILDSSEDSRDLKDFIRIMLTCKYFKKSITACDNEKIKKKFHEIAYKELPIIMIQMNQKSHQRWQQSILSEKINPDEFRKKMTEHDCTLNVEHIEKIKTALLKQNEKDNVSNPFERIKIYYDACAKCEKIMKTVL